MQPLWHNWYSQPLKGVLFALDVSDPPSLAAAGLELHRVMQVRPEREVRGPLELGER